MLLWLGQLNVRAAVSFVCTTNLGRPRCDSHRTDQAAIVAPFHVINRYVGNPPPHGAVFLDYPAPSAN
jgi:hypothetical protein